MPPIQEVKSTTITHAARSLGVTSESVNTKPSGIPQTRVAPISQVPNSTALPISSAFFKLQPNV